MTIKKYKAVFPHPNTWLEPSWVYVSPHPAYEHHFSVSVLHFNKTADRNAFTPNANLPKFLELETGPLFTVEDQSMAWAKKWLEDQSGLPVTLQETQLES